MERMKSSGIDNMIGRCLSLFNNRRHKTLPSSARSSVDGRADNSCWPEFETIVGQAFRERGYCVKELGGNGPDGEIDFELRMGAEKYLVQCKHWKAQKVGIAPVRELFGVMAAEGAIGGFVVASGEFTPDAKEFADSRSIDLIYASALIAEAMPLLS